MKSQYSLRLFLLIATSIIFHGVSVYAGQYGPSLLFHKPFSPEQYQGNFCMSFTAGQTSQGYNRDSKIVPFLQEYGSEDLLRRFIDRTVPKDDIESIGKINFSGTLDFQRLTLYYYKNIHHDLFIGIGTSIQNLDVHNIGTDITLKAPLNAQELHNLEIFTSKIPTNINTSGMLTTFIDLGFNKVFTHFTSVNFLQFFIKGSIATPQLIHGNNLSILQYPLAGNLSFAYPITAIVALGISKYINFGVYGAIIPFQPAQLVAPVKVSASQNQVLLTETTLLKVSPKPVSSAVFYLEAHSFLPNFMATMGYGSTYGAKWKIASYDQYNYPDEKINENGLLNSWNISSMFFQINYNFTSEKHPQAPHVSLFYVLPLSGKYYPKISAVGGSGGLTCTYQF